MAKRDRLRFLFALLVGACVLLGSASAQTAASGAVSCAVKDPTGAVIQNATVVVTSERTGEIRSSTTGPTGVARIGLLPPDAYKIEVTAQGFKTSIVRNVVVNVAEVTTVVAPLEVGGKQDVIVVRENPAMVQGESSTIGDVVSEQTMQSLPLVSRNFTQILALSSGVTADVYNATELGRNSSNLWVNGGREADNNFQMNGAEINNVAENIPGDYGGVGGIPIPNPDTIQEFKVQTALYDASFGRNAGGNVDVITKSGSNALHGSVFEFFRNDALNANDYFFNLTGTPRAALNENQFGFTLGGPVLKNRFFFFGSYQGTRQKNGVSSTSASTVLLPPLTNDRSPAALGAIFGGQSGFFGGVAVAPDGSNINPAALAILNAKLPNGQFLYPTPQTILPDGSGFSAFSIPATWTEDQFMVNLDYVATSKHTLTERYFYSHNYEQQPFPEYAGNVPGFPGLFNYRDHHFVLSDNYVPTPHLINDAKLAFDRFQGANQANIAFHNSDFGITSTPSNDFITLYLGPYAGIGPRPSHNTVSYNNVYSAYDTLAWTKGRHLLKVGGSYTYSRYNLDITATTWQELGFYTFADFLLGMSAAQNGSQYSNIGYLLGNQGISERLWPIKDFSTFVQDDFKVTNRLMLNLGVRYEYFGGVSDSKGRLANLWTETANPDPPAEGTLAGFVVANNYSYPLPPGVQRASNNIATDNPPRDNFEPRIGFALQPTSSRHFVIRGGYGLYHTRPTANLTEQPMFSFPFDDLVYNYGTGAALATLQQPFNPPLPPLSAFPLWVPYSPTSDLSGYSLAKNFGIPYTSQYSLNLEYAFTNDFRLDVGYVGSRAHDLLRSNNRNQADLASPADPIHGFTTNTVENSYSRVPILGIDPGYTWNETSGNSSYDSLQVSATKRLSRGLSFLASYTWSKTLTDTFSDWQNGGYLMGNQHAATPLSGVAEFSRPQRLVISYVYEFPRAFGAEGFAGKALSGWQVSGVTTFQAGTPLIITDSRGGTIFAASSNLVPAQLVPGIPIETSGSIEKRLNNYFNTSAFGLTPTIGDGTGFGNMMPGMVRGPDQRDFDIAITKETSVRENLKVEFRWEFFNAFNTPQFSNPSTDDSLTGFGSITSTSVNPRIMQVALKLKF